MIVDYPAYFDVTIISEWRTGIHLLYATIENIDGLSSATQHYELKFGPAIETEVKQTADNPKRRRRNAKKQVQISGVGTKSQQALQMQREEMKIQKRQISKAQREAEKQRQFDLKQQKQKARRRGH